MAELSPTEEPYYLALVLRILCTLLVNTFAIWDSIPSGRPVTLHSKNIEPA
jgi:hypothetical protein